MKKFVLTWLVFAAPLLDATKYPLDFPLQGKQGRYSKELLQMAKKGPRPSSSLVYPKETDAPVLLRALQTPSEEALVGVEQLCVIEAALDKVNGILARVEDYQKIFPGFKDIHLAKSDENLWVIFWEQIVPVFFLSNIKYEMFYLVHEFSAQKRVIYRYQLKETGRIKESDGIIILDAVSPSRTRYTEYDFFEPDLGLLPISNKQIWLDSLKGFYLSDVGIKLKAENPDWTFEKIRDAAEKSLEKVAIEEIAKTKVLATSIF